MNNKGLLMFSILAASMIWASPNFGQEAPHPAQPPQPPQTVQANLTRQFSSAMGAIAGRQTTFGDWYGVAADCMPLDWNEIIITRAPRHGPAQVISKNEPISFPDSNPRKACNGKPIAAKALIYTPDKTYAGSDTMAVQKVSSNGVMETVTYNITVLLEDAGDNVTKPEGTTDK